MSQQYITLNKNYETKQITIEDTFDYAGQRSSHGVLLLVNESEIFIDEENHSPIDQDTWVYTNPGSLQVYRFDLFRLRALTLASTNEGEFYYDTDLQDFRRNIDGEAITFTGVELWENRDNNSFLPSLGFQGIAESIYTPNDIPLYHKIKSTRKTWLAADCKGDDKNLIKYEKAFIAVDSHFNSGNHDRVDKILQFYNDN